MKNAIIRALYIATASLAAAQEGGTMTDVNGTDLYFLHYAISSAEPPFNELARMDTRFRSANEFSRESVLARVEGELRARADAVKGIRYIRVNLNDSFGEYDSKYKEFDFTLSDGNSVDYSAFGRSLKIVLTNGSLAQNWKVDPAEAEDMVRRTGGTRRVLLSMNLEILGATPPVYGAPLRINTRILQYEIRAQNNLRLGIVTVAK